MGRTLLKRFAAWATDLKARYGYDPFFRTQCNVILLQAMLGVAMLLFFVLAFNYIYQGMETTLLHGIRSTSAIGREIIGTADSVKTKSFFVIFSLSFCMTVVFSYFITRVALTPARDALASQKRFISDIAHELRTPLSVIKTNSEVAMFDATMSPGIRQAFESTITELDRTSDIINNLLSFSNWTSPERVTFKNVDVGPIVDSAIRKLQTLATSKNLSITTAKKPPHTVWGNETALEQIVINLVKNAINYTPPGGKITVTVEPDYQGGVLLLVSDTGIGIAQKDLFHIFEPFYRAERSRNRQTGSSGLGLTIVSELVKLHRGKITVKSTPNRGTTVIVRLHYNQDAVQAASEDDTDDSGDAVSLDFLRAAVKSK